MGNEIGLLKALKHSYSTPQHSHCKSPDIFDGIVRTGDHGLWFVLLHKVRE